MSPSAADDTDHCSEIPVASAEATHTQPNGSECHGRGSETGHMCPESCQTMIILPRKPIKRKSSLSLTCQHNAWLVVHCAWRTERLAIRLHRQQPSCAQACSSGRLRERISKVCCGIVGHPCLRTHQLDQVCRLPQHSVRCDGLKTHLHPSIV